MTTARKLIGALAACMAISAAANAQDAAATPQPTDAPAAVATTGSPPAPAAPAAPAADAAVPATPADPAPAAGAGSAPAAGTATVVFFRPSRFVGAAVGFIVREDQAELGKLRNGKYFILHVPPGRHEYVVHSEAKDTLNIDAEAGETYYIQGSLGMGIMVGRPNLSPSDEAAFESAKPKMKEVAPMSEKD